jgi:hypothetical protein
MGGRERRDEAIRLIDEALAELWELARGGRPALQPARVVADRTGWQQSRSSGRSRGTAASACREGGVGSRR